jgi:hypothetical protein
MAKNTFPKSLWLQDLRDRYFLIGDSSITAWNWDSQASFLKSARHFEFDQVFKKSLGLLLDKIALFGGSGGGLGWLNYKGKTVEKLTKGDSSVGS